MWKYFHILNSSVTIGRYTPAKGPGPVRHRGKQAMYNLTDGQKAILRWLVRQVRAGNLSEDIYIVWTMDGVAIVDFSGDDSDMPAITNGALDALARNDLLIVQPRGTRHEDRLCTLTRKAYQAVDDD